MSQLDASNIAYKRNDRTIFDWVELIYHLEFKLELNATQTKLQQQSGTATRGRRVMPDAPKRNLSFDSTESQRCWYTSYPMVEMKT